MARVLITGASAGLGAELAKTFAGRGYELVLAARRLARLEAMKPELLTLGAPEVVCYPIDLAEPAQVSKLAEALPSLALDVLINNAALGHWDALWDTSFETLDRMIAINTQALAHLTTRLLDEAHTEHPAARPRQAASRHVVPQAIRVALPLLEPDVEGLGVIGCVCPGVTGATRPTIDSPGLVRVGRLGGT